MRVNWKNYAMCDYNQDPSEDDSFELGDIMINKENEIGVIIQAHGFDEYRTDMWGNCDYSVHEKYNSLGRIASREEIAKFRPDVFTKHFIRT